MITDCCSITNALQLLTASSTHRTFSLFGSSLQVKGQANGRRSTAEVGEAGW
jgi:hypothetical protein